MRKYLTLGVLLCVCLVVVSLTVVVTISPSRSGVFADAAIYLMLAASFFYTKDNRLHIILISLPIIPDILFHTSITQGKVIYLSYAFSYLMSAYLIFLSLPKYKYTILFCIMMFIFQLFMALDYYLAMELALYEDPKTLLFIHYKSILYCLHLLIISSITDWSKLHKIGVCIDNFISVFRSRMASAFVD